MKAVVHDFIIQKNKMGQKITPIFLYSIQYDAVSNLWLRWCTGGADVTFDGVDYEHKILQHNYIKENSNGMFDKVNFEMSNANREIQYYLENYDGLKDKKCIITLVWKEAIDNPLCFLQYEYLIKYGSADSQYASLSLGSAFDKLDLGVPRRAFDRFHCQVPEFKGEDCGYSGVETYCDRKYETCERLGNIARFGAFPGVPMPFQRLVM